jgi:hypothetical protein
MPTDLDRLDRIERNVAEILHILKDGRKSYDMDERAKRVIEMKMRKKQKEGR